MNAFPIGTSALAVGNRALDLIGQNITNASTPGYHRQVVDLVSRTSSGDRGTGVDVASITRYTADPVRTAILRGNAENASAATRLDVRQQIEAALGAGNGGIGDTLEGFFNSVEQLTSNPADASVRRPVIAAADNLAKQFNAAATDLDKLRNDLGGQISKTVTEVNDFAKQIAGLNTRIASIESRGDQANDLRDQRDQLVDQLSQRVDIRTVSQPFGVVNVIASGAAIVVGDYANSFSVAPDATGNQVVTQAGSTQPVTFDSGKLGGQLREFNQDIPTTRARLDSLANQVIQRVNSVQATGINSSGPLTSASGSVTVADPTVPLAAAGLPFPISAGTLTVSVTDQATGNRTNTPITIDPSTQSLQDVAAALAGVPGLSASVDPTTNILQVSAQTGFAFDFAGRDTSPPSGNPVANPDSSGVLAGLGVNGLFSGSGAVGIAVRPEFLTNPGLLSASASGQPGDARNLEKLAASRDQPVFGNRTLSGEFADIASSVGQDIESLDDQKASTGGILSNLSAQEQSVTGVDINEELVHLLDFQRMIQAASKFMSVVNTSLDSVLDIIR